MRKEWGEAQMMADEIRRDGGCGLMVMIRNFFNSNGWHGGLTVILVGV